MHGFVTWHFIYALFAWLRQCFLIKPQNCFLNPYCLSSVFGWHYSWKRQWKVGPLSVRGAGLLLHLFTSSGGDWKCGYQPRGTELRQNGHLQQGVNFESVRHSDFNIPGAKPSWKFEGMRSNENRDVMYNTSVSVGVYKILCWKLIYS